jgi:hypothetical protein
MSDVKQFGNIPEFLLKRFIMIEINLLEDELKEIIPDDKQRSKVMFTVRMLQPRITHRLIAAENHLSENNNNHQQVQH